MKRMVQPNGWEVRSRRESHDLSRPELAKISGYSESTIERIESGAVTRERTMIDLAAALKCEVAELLTTSGDVAAVRESGLRGILPSRPSLLIGRGDDLARLVTLLAAPRSNGPVVMHGWPGVGKTTISAELVYEETLRRSFDIILWASLGEAPDIHSVVSSWCQARNCAALAPIETLEQAAARLREALTDKRVLIVIDDCWEAAHYHALDVGGESARSLVSTRLPKVVDDLNIASPQTLKLDVLSVDDGVRILAAFSPAIVESHRAECAQLVRQLEGLPLALQVAGRLLKAESRHSWGAADLLHELRTDSDSLLSEPAPPDMERFVGPSRSVAALLDRSVAMLDASTRAKYVALGAFAPRPATFDVDALAAVWGESPSRARQAIRTLTARGLLDPVESDYQMHGLLVSHARGLLSK